MEGTVDTDATVRYIGVVMATRILGRRRWTVARKLNTQRYDVTNDWPVRGWEFIGNYNLKENAVEKARVLNERFRGKAPPEWALIGKTLEPKDNE